MHKIVRYTYAAVAVAVLSLVWTFAHRHFANRPAERVVANRPVPVFDDYTGTGGPLKIVQFYAYPSSVAEGDRATLCYGVSGAASVRIEPPGEALSPSANRCFPITPDDSTKYTLTVKGTDGRTVSASFLLPVVPDPAMRPKILYFVKGKEQAARDVIGAAGRSQGTLHSLCFQAENVKEVRIDPPVFPPTNSIHGCFYVAPQRTTTYTLTVLGPKGRKAERQLTITPKPAPAGPGARARPTGALA